MDEFSALDDLRNEYADRYEAVQDAFADLLPGLHDRMAVLATSPGLDGGDLLQAMKVDGELRLSYFNIAAVSIMLARQCRYEALSIELMNCMQSLECHRIKVDLHPGNARRMHKAMCEITRVYSEPVQEAMRHTIDATSNSSLCGNGHWDQFTGLPEMREDLGVYLTQGIEAQGKGEFEAEEHYVYAAGCALILHMVDSHTRPARITRKSIEASIRAAGELGAVCEDEERMASEDQRIDG